jgi:large subunit ribosomal protein L10
MQRAQKEQTVNELQERFAGTQGAVLTDFQGMTVHAISEVRRAFREEGVSFEVVKNTLARRAVQGTPLEVLGPDFVGPIAIAYSKEDPVAPARIASKFAEKQEKFDLKCGFVDNGRIDIDGVSALAKLPGKDELRGKLLNLLTAPATQLVRTMNAVPQSVVLALSAYQAKLGEGSEEG